MVIHTADSKTVRFIIFIFCVEMVNKQQQKLQWLYDSERTNVHTVRKREVFEGVTCACCFK